MASSIYNVPLHVSSKSYSKNDIVFTRDNIGDSDVPRESKYDYDLKDVPAGKEVANKTCWCGYIDVDR